MSHCQTYFLIESRNRDQDEFVTLWTAFETTVSIGSDRLVGHNPGCVRLIGLRAGHLCIFIAEDCAPFEIALHSLRRNAILWLLESERCALGFPHAFWDRLNQKFIIATPDGRISVNQPVAGPWEQFTLKRVEPGAACRAMLLDLAAGLNGADQKLATVPRHSRAMLELVAGLQDGLLVPLVAEAEAADGFLGWAETFTRHDPWLKAVTDSLLTFRPPARSAAAARHMLLDPALDFLASAGADGRTQSAGHAIAKIKRGYIQPKRLCCIVTTIRNEGVYLIDWLAYHRSVGVEQFFVYSNDNSDGSDELLNALDSAGEIVWLQNSSGGAEAPQYKAYGHAFSIMPDILDFEWALVIDLDEYLVLDLNRFANLPAFLQWHGQRGAEAVALSWLMFGPNGQALWDRRPVTERFTRRSQLGPTHVKSVFRPSKAAHAQCHFPRASGLAPLNFVDAVGRPHTGVPGDDTALAHMSMAIDAGAWINHYWHKSAQEFIWRRSNSTGDQVVASGSIAQEALAQRFMEDFGQRWVRDDRVRSHEGPEEEAARLRNLPGVRFAEMQSRDLFCAMSLDKVRQNLRSGGPEARKLAELVTHAFDRPI